MRGFGSEQIAGLLTAGLLAWPGLAAGAPGSKDRAAQRKIQEAIEQKYSAGDARGAEALLLGTLKACADDCSPEVKARAWMYIGIIRSDAHSNISGAKAAFAQARSLDPEVKLDDALAQPQAEEAFGGDSSTEEAPSETGVEPAEAAPEAEPTAPAPAESKPTPAPAAGAQAAPAAAASEAAGARPEGLGQKGHVVLGVGRLFGYYSWSAKYDLEESDGINPPEEKASGSGLGLLRPGVGTSGAGVTGNPYAVPYVGLDVFVLRGVSLGGAFGTASDSGDSDESPETGATGLHARVGFATMVGSVVAIWPRLGLSFAWASTKAAVVDDVRVETSVAYTDLTVEVLVVIVPVEHVGLTVGPVLDLPLSGGVEVASINKARGDASYSNFGLAAGLVAYF